MKQTNVVTPLPIDRYMDQIVATYSTNQNLIVEAAPGSGKTTRIPPAIAATVPGKVIVLEPRRVAAIGAAAHIALEQGWQLGQEVGYQVRFQNCSRESTKLLFMTEALLLRKLQLDPELIGISAIILDEFHERSLNLDLTIALIKEMQELGAPIKMLIMSATLDSEKIANYLVNAPIIRLPGQSKALQRLHSQVPMHFGLGHEFYARVVMGIKQAWELGNRDTLVFLPGTGEINRVYDEIENWALAVGASVQRLHGKLSLGQQRDVIAPMATSSANPPRRRIILSTNIAESSLTIDGVDAVVDCGLARVASHNLQLGITSLNLRKISRSSAIQRAGRACRQYDGISIHLWNAQDEQAMPAHDLPEILSCDLAPALLFLSKMQIRDFANFTWFQHPGELTLTTALEKLRLWQAVDEDNRLTQVGEDLLNYPIDLRLARLMVEAKKIGAISLGALICAILEERDFLAKMVNEPSTSECDLLPRVEVIKHQSGKLRSRAISDQQFQRLIDIAGDLCRSAGNYQFDLGAVDLESNAKAKLLCAAFADRICRRRDTSDRGLMVGGRGVKVNHQSSVRQSEFFFALSIVDTNNQNESLVSIASGIDKRQLERDFADLITAKAEIYFDKEKGRVICRDYKCLGDLPIEDGRTRPLNNDECERHLPEFLLNHFSLALGADENLRSLWERLAYLGSIQERLPLALQEVCAEFFQADSFHHWQLQGCQGALYGETNIDIVTKKNLVHFFASTLPPELRQCLHAELPEKLTVPSGSQLKIHYEVGKDPYLQVRIQEIFGWAESPKLAFGKIALALHLLGPNFRPVQITTNLQSFWSTTYTEVRKELRSRYPKHQWPEDPAMGIAEAKGRRRT